MISASKETASLNALDKYSTAAVFQPLMSWLKSVAPLKMSSMSVTLCVFQLAMFLLNLAAPQNAPHMLVTELVFQLEISALNRFVVMVKLWLEAELSAKRYLSDCTPLTSHVLIGAMVKSLGLLTSVPDGALPQFTPVASLKMH